MTKRSATAEAEDFAAFTDGDGTVRVRVYPDDWHANEPLVPIVERSGVVRIYRISDFTLCEQAELLLSQMTDSSGPLVGFGKFIALLDYPTATQPDRPTVRVDVALNEREAFANFVGSHIIPVGIFVVVPRGAGVARIVMRLLHDFNMYQHERSHDI